MRSGQYRTQRKISGHDGIGRHARFRFSYSDVLGFESPCPHQTNIIRTRSSLWETGSDYLFSLGGSRKPISETALSSVRNPSREGLGKRSRYSCSTIGTRSDFEIHAFRRPFCGHHGELYFPIEKVPRKALLSAAFHP